MNIKNGLCVVVLSWATIGVLFGGSYLIYKASRFVSPEIFMAILVTVLAFIMGSFIK